MIVVFSENFSTQLDELIAFIANDSLQKANKFDKELRINLNTLDFMPYKYRKSVYFDDENVRDFVFKGFVVPYFINEKTNEVVVLGICKKNIPKFNNHKTL